MARNWFDKRHILLLWDNLWPFLIQTRHVKLGMDTDAGNCKQEPSVLFIALQDIIELYRDADAVWAS